MSKQETETYETVQIPKATADYIRKQERFKLYTDLDEFVMEAVRLHLKKLQLTEKTATPESKKDFKDNLDFVTLKIKLAKPFVDFIEDYRKYFGSQYTTEMICMKMIYDHTKHLFNELDGFARDKNHFLDKGDFFTKYFYLGTVSWEEPEDETE
jgi:hypothetical protein